MRVGITGGSGLIGRALSRRLLSERHDVVPFVRRAAAPGEVFWDPVAGVIDRAELGSLDAIVHLAGVGIAEHRWTDDHKRAIAESRINGTTLLSEAIAEVGGPAVLLSGSAIGYYGDGDVRVNESSPPGDDFLAKVCVDWERSTAAAAAAGTRVVHLRTGIVLSDDGGALAKMLPIFKLGLGGRFGDGTQWMSWIAIDDEVGAITHLLTSAVEGPVNLTAPHPVRNLEFVKALGEALHRPSIVPVPRFAPRLLLGTEAADNLLFNGQRVDPKVLTEDGYEFQFPGLDEALAALLT